MYSPFTKIIYFYSLPPYIFGAVFQSYQKCCLPSYSPHFIPNKTWLTTLTLRFFFFFFKSTPFGAAPQSDLRGSLPGYSPQWGSRLKRISRLSFHFSLHYPLPWREVFGASGKHGWQNWASKRFGKCWSWWEDKREWGILTKEEPVAAPNVRTWSGHGVKAAPSHFAVQQALFPTSSLSARAIEVRMHWRMIRK